MADVLQKMSSNVGKSKYLWCLVLMVHLTTPIPIIYIVLYHTTSQFLTLSLSVFQPKDNMLDISNKTNLDIGNISSGKFLHHSSVLR